jgi:hypothetical protein
LISDISLYGIGRLWGTKLLEHRWTHRLMPPGKRERIQANFERFGVKILLLVRWLPGIRSPMFITAGTMRLTISRFIIADAVAAAVGHALLFFLAYLGGKQVQDFAEGLENKAQSIVRPLLILGAILAVTIYLLVHFWKRPVTTGDPKEFPLIGPQVVAKITQIAHKDESGSPASKDKAPPSKADVPQPSRDGPPPGGTPSANGMEQNQKTPGKSPAQSVEPLPSKAGQPPGESPSANGMEQNQKSPERPPLEERKPLN